MTTSLTRDELLTLLIKQCGEVAEQAKECLGDGYYPKKNEGANSTVLARKVGEFLAVTGELPLDRYEMEQARSVKIDRAERVKGGYALPPVIKPTLNP